MTIITIAVVVIVIALIYIFNEIQKIYREIKEVNERLSRKGMLTLEEKLIETSQKEYNGFDSLREK